MVKTRMDSMAKSEHLPGNQEPARVRELSSPRVPVERLYSLARYYKWLILGALFCVVAVAIFVWRGERDVPVPAGGGAAASAESGPSEMQPGEAIRVEIVRPEPHGLGRKTTQPGSVHAFEYAELYAKVSGYLGEQNVDIGDHVKRGQLLARIDIPELAEDVKEAEASLERAKSVVVQNEARIKTSEADAEAAAATIKKALADVISAKGQVRWRKSDYERMKGLVKEEAIEKKIEDERLNAYTAAQASEAAAEAGVENARAQSSAAQARVGQAKADLLHAKADLDVVKTVLDKTKVMFSYTRIESPYDGVVTARKFHRGSFIRAANDGGTVPLLTVAQTDPMRVVVQVPDRDVPYTTVGDEATIEIDALPGRYFTGKVSRMADIEDPLSRTMRVEIDLPNPDNLLREGMYSRRATIQLEPASSALSIPSAALVGKGSVWIVRNGESHLAPVEVGQDDGLRMEILSGLKADDQVVVGHAGSLSEGTPVEVIAAADGKTGKSGGASH